MRKLTAKQRAFVDEYLIDMNATKAAIRAGYSIKTAKQIGTENLSKPVLKKAINDALEERSKRCELDAEKVIELISQRAIANHLEFFGVSPEEWADLPINERLTLRARMLNIQNKNLEQLAKHHQIYVPKPGFNMPTFDAVIDLGWDETEEVFKDEIE